MFITANLAFCLIFAHAFVTADAVSVHKNGVGSAKMWTSAMKSKMNGTGQALFSATPQSSPSNSTMDTLQKVKRLADERRNAMNKYYNLTKRSMLPALEADAYRFFSNKHNVGTNRQLTEPTLTMSNLNFESCTSDIDCLGARTCVAIGETELLSCAGTDCFCITADPVCFGTFQCSPGEFCEDETNFCVASSVVIGTELNGESCLDTFNCSPIRSCIQINDDGSSALCSGLNCFCATEDPSCTTELDCDAGESCLSFDGVRICLANAVLPVAPLSLSAQPCQQDSDCFDPSSRVCAKVQDSPIFEACDGGLCACLPLTGCLDSIECFLGETCATSESGGICIEDGTLQPPPSPPGFNFEPCTVNGDCQPFRTCVESPPSGNGAGPVPCQGGSCFCLTENPGCSGPESFECSFGESCFSSGGSSFSCTSDAIIPFMEPA